MPLNAGLPPVVLRKRADFLKAASALRVPCPAFLVQARKRGEGEALEDQAQIRVGFTCSKKVGNAVARNRAKRRLREVARLVLPSAGEAGWDYVLVGRAEVTASRDFAAMQSDFRDALEKVHSGKASKSSPRPGRRGKAKGRGKAVPAPVTPSQAPPS